MTLTEIIPAMGIMPGTPEALETSQAYIDLHLDHPETAGRTIVEAFRTGILLGQPDTTDTQNTWRHADITALHHFLAGKDHYTPITERTLEKVRLDHHVRDTVAAIALACACEAFPLPALADKRIRRAQDAAFDFAQHKQRIVHEPSWMSASRGDRKIHAPILLQKQRFTDSLYLAEFHHDNPEDKHLVAWKDALFTLDFKQYLSAEESHVATLQMFGLSDQRIAEIVGLKRPELYRDRKRIFEIFGISRLPALAPHAIAAGFMQFNKPISAPNLRLEANDVRLLDLLAHNYQLQDCTEFGLSPSSLSYRMRAICNSLLVESHEEATLAATLLGLINLKDIKQNVEHLQLQY
jgi:hypothetical protein